MADDPRLSTLLPLQMGVPASALPPLAEATTAPAALRTLLRLTFARYLPVHALLGELGQCLVAGDVGGVRALCASGVATAPAPVPPLALACALGEAEAAALLRQHGGAAALHACDGLGNTALHWAAMVGDVACMRRLRAAGVEDGARNAFGGTAADYADAWRRAPPHTLALTLQRRDGSRQALRDNAACRATLGFTYMPSSRPQVDLFLQMAVSLVTMAPAQLAPLAHAARGHALACPAEPEMYLRDDGPPWDWGVCVRDAVPAGAPVGHYGGHLVHTLEIASRHRAPAANAYACYVAPTPALGQLLACHVDAARCGNLGSRYNGAHVAAAANLRAQGGYTAGLPRLAFLASRDIAAGEQLCWDYGAPYWRAVGIAPSPLRP